jgi:hypothetical protein
MLIDCPPLESAPGGGRRGEPNDRTDERVENDWSLPSASTGGVARL